MRLRNTRKDFLSMKEFEEGLRDWMFQNGWSFDHDWNNAPHKACSHTPGGNWKLQSYGHYEASDWLWRNYVSYRCNKCGMLVQYNQVFAEDGQPLNAISRLVIVP